MHSLKGGKIVLIKSDGSEAEVLKAKSKCFRIGSFLSCDLVLDDADAKDVHCDINCDAFGRITITNHCKRNPVKVNGIRIKGTQRLYNNSHIEILGKQLRWEFTKKTVITKRKNDQNATPENRNKQRAEQAPNSAPSLRTTKHKSMKRMTMHNLAHNQELSTDSETDADEQNDAENQHNLKKSAVVSATISSGVTPPRTPKPRISANKVRRQTIDCSTPVRVTFNQQNNSNYLSGIKNKTPKLKLLQCQQSDIVVTSYSPNVTESKTPKSFAVVKSSKGTPASVYGTPNSVFSDVVDGKSCDMINLQSPTSPKPQKSMYLINLSTPENMKTPIAQKSETPLLRSALKNSAKAKALSQVKRKTRFSLFTEEYDPDLSVRSTKVLKDENAVEDGSPLNPLNKSLQLELPASSTSSIVPENQMSPKNKINQQQQTPDKTPLKIVNLSEDQLSEVKALRASLLIKGKFDTPNKSSTPIPWNRMRKGLKSPGVENVFEEASLDERESFNENKTESKNNTLIKESLKNSMNTKDLKPSEKSLSQLNMSDTLGNNTTKKNFIEINKDVSRYAKRRSVALNRSLPDQSKSKPTRFTLNKSDISLAKKEILLQTVTDNKMSESSKLFVTPIKISKVNKFNLSSSRNEKEYSKLNPVKRLSACKTPLPRKTISAQTTITPNTHISSNNSRLSLKNTNKSRRSLSIDTSVNKSQHKVTDNTLMTLKGTPVKKNYTSLSEAKQNICPSPIKHCATSDAVPKQDPVSTPKTENLRASISANKSRRSVAMNTSINKSQQHFKNISPVTSQELSIKECLSESTAKVSVSTLGSPPTKDNTSSKGSFKEHFHEISPINQNDVVLADIPGSPSKQSTHSTESSINLSGSAVKQINLSTSNKVMSENTDQSTVQDLNITFTEDNDNASDNLEDSDNNVTNLTFSIDSEDENNVDDIVINNKEDLSSATNQFNRSLKFSRNSIHKNPEAVENYVNFLENIHGHKQVKNPSSESSNIDSAYEEHLDLDLDRYIAYNNEFPNSTQDISIGTEAKLLEEEIPNLSAEKTTTSTNDLHQNVENDLLNSPERERSNASICIKNITPKDGVNSNKDLKTGSRKTRSCRNDLTNVVGVKELLKTPTNPKDPSLLGIRELLKTPKLSSARETLVGVKELMKTPKNEIDNSDNVKGVRELLNTPARDDITDVIGVKELMKTPMLRTPKLVGVKELLKTPNITKSKTPNLVGVKELMKTPKITTFADDYDGLENVFKTPASRMVMVLGSPKSTNISRDNRSSNMDLLKTPGDYDLQEDMVGVEALFKTPGSKFIDNDMESSISSDSEFKIKKTSNDIDESEKSTTNAFDLLSTTPVKPEVSRTYSRTPARQSVFPIPFVERSESSQLPKTDVQKWVDNSSSAYEDVEEDEVEEVYDVEDSTDSIIFTTQSNESIVGSKMQVPAAISSNHKNKSAKKTQGFEKALNFSQVSGIAMIDDSTIDIEGNHIEAPTVDAAVEPLPEEEEEEEELFIDLVEDEDSQKSDSNTTIILDSTVESSACINICEQTSNSDVEYVDFISDERPSTRQSRRQTRKETSLQTITSEKRFDSTSRLRGKSQTPLRNKVIEANARRTRAESIKSTNKKEKYLQGNKSVPKERSLRSRSQTPYKQPLKSKDKSIKNATSDNININVKTPENNKTRSPRQIIASTPLSTVSNAHGLNSNYKNFSTMPAICLRRGRSLAPGDAIPIGGYREKKSRKTLGLTPKNDKSIILRTRRSSSVPNIKSDSIGKGQNVQKSPVKNNRSKSLRKYSSENVEHTHTESVEKTYNESNEQIKDVSQRAQSSFKEIEESSENMENRGNEFAESKINIEIDKNNSNMFGQKQSNHDGEIARHSFETESPLRNFNAEPIRSTRSGRSLYNSEKDKNNANVSRKTLGHKPSDEDFDVEAVKKNYVLESQFKNFSDSPVKGTRRGKSFVNSEHLVQISKVSRKTLGQNPSEDDFDIEAAKEQYEFDSQFKNFSNSPIKGARRGRSFVNSEDLAENSKVFRKTLGQKPSEDDFDIEAAKEQYEFDSQFMNFSNSPIKGARRGRSFVNSEDLAENSKVSRKTLGQKPSEDDFDIEAAKEQYEFDSQFKNFRDSPVKGTRRGRSLAKSEDLTQNSKASRKTLGNKPSDGDFDIEAEKEQYEFDSQFKNFSDSPVKGTRRGRSFVNSEDLVQINKVSRKTLGHKPSDGDFDIEAEKEQYEFDSQFKNFTDSPVKGTRRGRSFVNSEDLVQINKVSRKTLGHKPSDGDFDIEAEKEQYEFDSQFKKFTDSPVKGTRRGRSLIKSEDLVQNSKVSRKTLGHKPSEDDFDIEAAKEQYEFESQFKNFSDSPIKGARRGRSFVNSEELVQNSQVSRKTLGQKPSEDDFDIEAAKEQYEFDSQFKNFRDSPVKGTRWGRSLAKSEDLTQNSKTSRKTLGNKPSDGDFDIEAEKEQYEFESQFKNFSNSPIKGARRGRSFVNSEDLVQYSQVSRKTLGHKPFDGDFDIEAEKERYEFESQFKNFSDSPVKGTRRGRSFAKSEDTTQNSKVSRKTLGQKPSVGDFDIEAAKEQYEFECQFKNFSDSPVKGTRRGRSLINSEDLVQSSKVSRKTLGNKPSGDDFDIEAAKEQYEFESQFKNFSDLPIKGARRGRSFVNSEDLVQYSKVSRKTLGHKPSDGDFDIEAEKERYEFESQFKNFSDSPVKGTRRGRSFVKSEDTTQTSKVSRKTLGNKPSVDDFDIEAAKEQYEFESQFKNFSDLPIKGTRRGRSFINSSDEKKSAKSRKTEGQVSSNEMFNIQDAKDQYEHEQQFQDFSETPIIRTRVGRSYGSTAELEDNSETPSPHIKELSRNRKTMGQAANEDSEFNIEDAKKQYEIEVEFKNFNEIPVATARRGRSLLRTSNNSDDMVSKSKSRETRKTLGQNSTGELFDVAAAKHEHDMNIQFKDFVDHPIEKVNRGRSVSSRDMEINTDKQEIYKTRKTVGDHVGNQSFDLNEAKRLLEIERANAQKESNTSLENVEEATTDTAQAHSSVSELNLDLERSITCIPRDSEENVGEILLNLDGTTRPSDTFDICTPEQSSLNLRSPKSQISLSMPESIHHCEDEANKERITELNTLIEPSPLRSIENKNKIKLRKSITPSDSKKFNTLVESSHDMSKKLSTLNVSGAIDNPIAFNIAEKENHIQEKLQTKLLPARRKRRLYSADVEYDNIPIPKEIVRTYQVKITDDNAEVVFKSKHPRSNKKLTGGKKVDIHDEVLAQLSAIAEERKILDSQEILISDIQTDDIAKSEKKLASAKTSKLPEIVSEESSADTTEYITPGSKKLIASTKNKDSSSQSEIDIQEKSKLSLDAEEISSGVRANTVSEESVQQTARRGSRKRVPPASLHTLALPKPSTKRTTRGKKNEIPVITVVEYEHKATRPSILKNNSPMENLDKDKKKVLFNEIISQRTIPIVESVDENISPEKAVLPKEKKRGRTRGKNVSSLETEKNSEKTEVVDEQKPEEMVHEAIIAPIKNRPTRTKQTKKTLALEIDEEINASTAQEPLKISLSENEIPIIISDEVEITKPKKVNLKSTTTRGRKSKRENPEEKKEFIVTSPDIKNENNKAMIEETVADEKPSLNIKDQDKEETSTNEEEEKSAIIDNKNNLKTVSTRGRKYNKITEVEKTTPADPPLNSSIEKSDVLNSSNNSTESKVTVIKTRVGRIRKQEVIDSATETQQIVEKRPRRGRKAVIGKTVETNIESSSAITDASPRNVPTDDKPLQSPEISSKLNLPDVEFKTPQSTIKALPRARRLRSNSLQQNSPMVLGNSGYSSFNDDAMPKTNTKINTSTPQSLNKLNVSDLGNRVTRRLRSNSVTDSSVIDETLENVKEPVITRRGRRPALVKVINKEPEENTKDKQNIVNEKDQSETETEPAIVKPKRGRTFKKTLEEDDKTPEKKVVKRTRRGANQKTKASTESNLEKDQSQSEASPSDLQNGASGKLEEFVEVSETSEEIPKVPEEPSRRPTRGKRKNYAELETEVETKESARPKRSRRKV